jgi:glycosyltransferase involved in cell wall biosynthesis
MRPLKIAYITSVDPRDKHAWSGTAHYLYKALERNGCQVELLGPVNPGFKLFLCKVFQAFSIYIYGKRFDFRHSTYIAKAYGRIFGRRLKKKNYDLIIAPGGVAYTAYLKTEIPIVLVLDRSLGNAMGYHSVLSNLWSFSKRQSLTTDKTAMEKAALVIFSSDWAANYARKEYEIPSEKIVVLPFGANLDEVPRAEEVLKQKKTDACDLLLVGTYWKNKGADIAVRALELIRKKGIEARLSIVGCTAPEPLAAENVFIVPFINKNTKAGKKKMEELFLEHNFFILPTRFEAFGIVFCEASAYGLISLGADTGGVSGAIKDGVNGYLIDHKDQGEAYAEKIAAVFSDKTKMKQLAESARNYYEEKLNWDAWVKEFFRLAETLKK